MITAGAKPDAGNAAGESPLFFAVRANSPSTINVLLANGASIAGRDKLGNSALHAAVRWDAPQAATALLDAGADINAHTIAGETPLHEAITLGVTRVATVLLNHGADIEARDNQGNTPLIDAVVSGYPDMVKVLISRGANVMDRNIRGDTPLHLAVTLNQVNAAQQLLAAGASIHARNNAGMTPFRDSLIGDGTMIPILLAGGRASSSDDSGDSPLHIAISDNVSTLTLETIIGLKARLDAVDAQGKTPMRRAADLGYWKDVATLSQAGSSPFIVAGDGKTPADVAIADGVEAVKAMFSGAAINKRDSSLNTVLHYAAKSGSADVVRTLISLGCDRTAKNIQGQTAADIAKLWKRSDIATMLQS
jgi:ankyrin repeat protein